MIVYPVKPLLHLFIWGDKRFGDDWPARHRTRLSETRRDKRKTCSGEAGGPGRIPAQMIAHILYYFSEQGDLVLDPTRPLRLKAEPMAGRWQAVAWWRTPAWRSTGGAGALISERFNAGVVSAMQKKKMLGVTSRYIIISEKK